MGYVVVYLAVGCMIASIVWGHISYLSEMWYPGNTRVKVWAATLLMIAWPLCLLNWMAQSMLRR